MFTQEELSALADMILSSDRAARLYPAVPVGDGLWADALLVSEDGLAVIENTAEPEYPSRSMKMITDSCAKMFEETYAVTDWMLRKPPGWGTIQLWEDEAYLSSYGTKRKPPIWAQLNLLWKSELRAILEKQGREAAPEDAPKAELIARIMRPKLTKAQQTDVALLMRKALLNRDYEAVGRADYTFNQAGDAVERAFGCREPAPRVGFEDENAWRNEVWDDPEYRRAPMFDATKSELTRRAQAEATKVIKNWRTRGISVNSEMRSRLVASLMREMLGAETPKRTKAYPGISPAEIVVETEKERPANWVTWKDIRAVPGVPWISEDIIDDFARFLASGRHARKGEGTWSRQGVKHSASTGKWAVKYSRPTSWTSVDYARLESMFGVPGYNGLRILESLLNLRQPKLDNEEKTLAILERQDLIIEVFEKWLWSDPERRERIEEEYNQRFAAFDIPPADGSKLTFPGMSEDVTLYPHQKDAVQKILADKNTLLAFDTGAGKTYIMIAAAMKLRQMKKSRKNMFVVPNNIVGQWEAIFRQMYPAAKLLVVDPTHFKPHLRREMLEKMKRGSYDGIIIAYSCLEQIPLSEKWIKARLKKESAKLDAEAKDMHYDRQGFSSLTRQIKSAKDAMAAEAKKLLKLAEKVAPDAITFDQLGITGIFLDEAHNYKNVPVRSSLGSIGGLNAAGSVKCLAMLNKVRCVQERSTGRGAVLATATPLSNSLADAFVMQNYVQPDALQATELHTFDNWVKSFAKPEYVCEIDVDTSRFRYVKRLARFYNIPELSRMFSSSTSFYAMNEKDGLPDLLGYTNILIDRGEPLHRYMMELCERTERIRARHVPPTVDNMLKVSTEGRLAALDLRLVGHEQPFDSHSKIHACVDSVLDIYNSYEGCTQIVFCDYSTPKADAFNVYDDVKRHLLDAGIPSKEIAFIHSYTTEAKKLELYRQVNEGEVRILIGSTFKLGIGTNVQTKLKAIHHLDIPWRPADMVQREGRILRQGNTNDTIKICRYISEGSFDAYSWQILERKQAFIAQFLGGTAYERSASDLEDTVLTYAQVKSLAISEPLMKDLAEKENEIRRLRMLATNFVQTNAERTEALEKKREQEKVLRGEVESTTANAEYAQELTEKQLQEVFREYRDVLSTELLTGNAVLIAPSLDVLGFSVALPPKEEWTGQASYVWVERGDSRYRVKMGDSSAGNLRRVLNFIKKLPAEQTRLEEQLDDLNAQIKGAEEALAESNPYPAQISRLQEEAASLRTKILERQSELEYA